MQDIVLTLQEHLNIFLNSDIRYQLRDNPNKACPEDINHGNSVFVCLPMYLLDEYEDLLRLIVYQTISCMERRCEDWKQGAVLILDELARLGKLENLLPFLAVNRSLGVSCIMAYQDFSQKEEVLDIAQKNTESAEYSCKGLDQVMREIMASEGMDEELMDELLTMPENSFYVISNQNRMDGSCAIDMHFDFCQKATSFPCIIIRHVLLAMEQLHTPCVIIFAKTANIFAGV